MESLKKTKKAESLLHLLVLLYVITSKKCDDWRVVLKLLFELPFSGTGLCETVLFVTHFCIICKLYLSLNTLDATEKYGHLCANAEMCEKVLQKWNYLRTTLGCNTFWGTVPTSHPWGVRIGVRYHPESVRNTLLVLKIHP